MTKFYLLVRRYLTVAMVLGVSVAFAQQTVRGKVTSSDDGAGIPGVNILEKGTSNGTVTDVDGGYTITVGANATLVFSFVGYATQEVAVGSQTAVDVSMQSDVTALSEVVVIGYGESTKKDLTGSLVSVKSESFVSGVIASPEQLIQGKAAGVQVTSASGEPGAGVSVRIRGTSSVRGGNNPLFVVDGIPLTDDSALPGGADLGRGTASAKNPLNFLNPNDIESMDVLKDASATAIYGSRGANGVVIITTKSGKGKKGQFEYDATVSVSERAKKYDLLNRDQFLAAVTKYGGDASTQDFGGNTDWQDQISRVGIQNRHNLSYADNFKTGGFRASFSYDNQQGIIKNTGFERISGRVNAYKNLLDDKLKLNVQMSLSNINDQAAAITNTAGFEGDLLGATIMANPTWPAVAGLQFGGSIANPLALLKYFDDRTKTIRGLFNFSAAYDITKELNLKVNTGLDRSNAQRGAAYSPLLSLGNGVFGNGRAAYSNNSTESDLLEAYLNFKKDLDGSTVTVLAGFSYQSFVNKGVSGQGFGFSDSNLSSMINFVKNSVNPLVDGLGGNIQQYGFTPTRAFTQVVLPSPATNIFPYTQFTAMNASTASMRSFVADGFNTKDELQSFFGRVNYSIGEKYLFTASFRADGSSKFGPNNKYGYFPSAAAAWRLSEESFVPDFFDDLKLRVGYGVTGSQSIPHNLFQQRQRYLGFGVDRGLAIQNDGSVNLPPLNTIAVNNPDLKWEQTTQINAGIDFGIFGNKLTGSIDYYSRSTSDLLIQQFFAQPAAGNFIWDNLDAKVVNSGLELTLDYSAISKENSSLSFNFNGAINNNEVRDFTGTLNTGVINGQGLSGAFAQRIASGQPLGAFFLRDFAGYDANGLAIYNGGDVQQFLGKSPIPSFNLGFTTNYRYKSLDATVFFTGQFGHYVYNNTTNAFFTAGSIGNARNVTVETLNSPEAPINSAEVSTRFLESADFLRFQNFSLGYNLTPKNVLIKKMRVWLGGQNLFVLTSYTGLDPEVNTDKNIDGVPSLGIDYNAYPRARVYTFGLSATF
jgi:TonB-dependent starch-binding outer membrane protein SusC